MKVKAMPQTRTVKGLLEEQLKRQNDRLFAAQTELDKLNNGGLIIHTPGRDMEVAAKKQAIQFIEGEIEELGDKLIILDSHQAPRVMTEIDV